MTEFSLSQRSSLGLILWSSLTNGVGKGFSYGDTVPKSLNVSPKISIFGHYLTPKNVKIHPRHFKLKEFDWNKINMHNFSGTVPLRELSLRNSSHASGFHLTTFFRKAVLLVPIIFWALKQGSGKTSREWKETNIHCCSRHSSNNARKTQTISEGRVFLCQCQLKPFLFCYLSNACLSVRTVAEYFKC